MYIVIQLFIIAIVQDTEEKVTKNQTYCTQPNTQLSNFICQTQQFGNIRKTALKRMNCQPQKLVKCFRFIW